MLKKKEFPYSYINYKYAFDKNISMLTHGHLEIGDGHDFDNLALYILAEKLEDYGYDIEEVTNKLDVIARIPWDRRKKVRISIHNADTGFFRQFMEFEAWKMKNYLIHYTDYIEVPDLRSKLDVFISEIEGKWKAHESKQHEI